MNKKDFERLSDEGFNHVPLVLETFADLDTPLSIYLKYANQPYSYLLESVQGGEQFGRYSFIGLPSKVRYEVRGHACSEIRETSRDTLGVRLVNLDEGISAKFATIDIRKGKAFALRKKALSVVEKGEWDQITIQYGDESTFIDSLLWHLDDVVVIEPSELRESVVKILSSMVVNHG